MQKNQNDFEIQKGKIKSKSKKLSYKNTDMRIVLFGSGCIFVNLSGSSPYLKICEAN